jgi:hypothetical protein
MKNKTILAACALLVSNLTFAKTTNSNNIKFSVNLPENQVESMKSDLTRLSDFKFSNISKEELAILGLKELSANSANKWLSDRIEYITESVDNNQLNKILKVSSRPYPYSNPGILPIIEESDVEPSGEGVTVMSNLGAGIYNWGKTVGRLVSMEMNTENEGRHFVSLTSPRSGIITVGEGLFMDRIQINPEVPKAESNSLNRLSVFFHEARHSDGNSKSLAFSHAVCPEGHDFQGYHACDRNLNGPYKVGSIFTKNFVSSCVECTDVEREVLMARYLDSENRIIHITKNAYSSRIEEIQSLISMNEMGFKTPGSSLEYLKRELAELESKQAQNPDADSTHWDATHEGRR